MIKRTLLILLATLCIVGTANAQPFRITGGHADINLEFDGTDLEIGFHTEFTSGMTTITGGAPQQNEFEAADIIVNVPVGTTTTRPADASFDPIGVPAGQRIIVMPQTEAGSEAAGVVFLGWAAEELTAADWSGDLTWTLTGVSGPGAFSAYGSGLTPNFDMASSDGVTAGDSFTMEAGHHEHFNLGFSAPGTYQIQLQVSGTHNTAGAVSTTGTLTFDVAAAPFRINGGHADVNLEFDGTELEVGFHTEFTGGMTEISGGAPQQNEFEASDIVVNVPVGTTTTRPAGSEFDPIGVPAGQRINVMPQTEAGSEAAGVVFLGWGAEELTAADWTGDLTWTLTGVSGPGQFSAYSSGLSPNFDMASSDGITAADSFTMEAGHHEHFNLGFSEPGTYQIQVQVAGTHNTAGSVSTTQTLTFDVAAAPFRINGGHADINLEFDGSELEVGFHTEFTGGHTDILGGAPQQNEFEASDIVVNVPVGTTTTRPADASFDPIGVPGGQRINVMPQTEAASEAAGVVFLGWAAEELTAADWSGDLTWTLTGVSGPGTFSAYGSGLTPNFEMASSDGIGAGDSFTMEAGHHEHFNLGFSHPGTYQIQLQVSGTHNTAGAVSTTQSLTFDVAASPFRINGGHADVNLEFDGSELEVGFHTEFTGGHTEILGGAPAQNEFEASDIVVNVPVGTTTTRPAGSEFDPIGVPAGQRINIMPQTEEASEAAGVVRLGWAAEELTAADWTGDLTWTLTGVTGPGTFSVYESGLTPNFHMASADGLGAGDAFSVEAGHHEHFNLGFSAPGTYQIQLNVAGTHNTAGVVNSTSTLTFDVVAAPYRLTGGHADVNLEFDGSELDVGFHTEFTDGHTQITGGAPAQNEFEASDLIIDVSVGTTLTRPGAASFLSIGVPAGQRINVMPQTEAASQAAGVVRLGWAAEELTAADWSGNLSWTLTGVSGPGAFSVYRSGVVPTFLMASFNGLSAGDSFNVEAGHHEHFNIGFSHPGTYQVQLTVAGTHNTAGTVSSTRTLTFDVTAQPYQLTGGHGDVNLELDGNEFEIGFHTEFTAGMTTITGGAPQQNEFEASDLDVIIPAASVLARPPGPEWDPTGVSAGGGLYVLPQTEDASETAGAVFLGWATEELTAADWSSDITWTLNGVTGPGHFSVYESGLTPTFRMSTADGISASDSFAIEAGHHEHFNLGFSQPGLYLVNLTAAGTHNTLGAVSGTGTLMFVVNEAAGITAGINAGVFSAGLPVAVLGSGGSLALDIPAGAVTGTGLSYQWQLDGVDIPGATSATLYATDAVPGNYRVIITGATGPAVTSPNVPVLRVTTIFVAGAKVEGPTAGLNLILQSSDAIRAPTTFEPVQGSQAVPDGNNVLRLLDVNRDPATIGSRFFQIGVQQPQP